MSILAHKEFRFLLVILPFLLIIPAYGFYKFPTAYRFKVFYFCLILNFGVTFWEERNYRSGSLDLMDYVRNNEEIKDLYLFDSHHSFPFYSHVHRNITMDFPSYNAYERKNTSLGDWNLFLSDPKTFINDKKDYNWIVTSVSDG